MNSYGDLAPVSWPSLINTNEHLRKKTYVHCWSMRAAESAWMWNSFLENITRSVVVRSTIGRLIGALRGQPVDVKRVIYYPRGQPRPDYSYTAPFAAKDKIKYQEDRELRLSITTGLGVPEGPDHELFSVDTASLVGNVIVHPLSSPGFQDEVRAVVARHSIPCRVARSRLAKSDLEAVARAHLQRASKYS